MVFGMLQRHGGELEIDSELGKGTTLRLIFPAAAHRQSVRDGELRPALPPLRILLIDDDPLVLRRCATRWRSTRTRSRPPRVVRSASTLLRRRSTRAAPSAR